MARKSDGSKIDDLIVLTATLNARLDALREEVKDIKRQMEESGRKLWMIVPPIIAAFVAAGLTALVNLAFSRH